MRVALVVLALVLTSCDSSEVATTSVGFENEPPRPVVAGSTFRMTAAGRSNFQTFQDVKLIVLRGSFASNADFDTLAAVPLDVQAGVSEFEATAFIAVPADLVTEAQTGRVSISYRDGRCGEDATSFGCRPTSTGTEVEIVPAP